MQNKLISIICTVFNKERYVEETINSVLKQNSRNWELLLIDDGSTDKSVEIAKHYAIKDKRIKFYKRSDFKKSKGASVCRNIGIEKAQGEYIMFLDADDILAEFCIKRRLEYAINTTTNVIIFKAGYFQNGKLLPNNLTKKIKELLVFGIRKNRSHFARCFTSYYLPWTISDPLWKKNTLITLGGFNEDFQRLQDPEIHTRLCLNDDTSFKLVRSNAPDVWIRVDEDRRAFNNEDHYLRHKKSVLFFASYFERYLVSENKLSYSKNINNYYISVYQTALYYFGPLRAIQEFKSIYPYKMNLLIKLILKSGSIMLLRKLKVTSLLINLYRIKGIII